MPSESVSIKRKLIISFWLCLRLKQASGEVDARWPMENGPISVAGSGLTTPFIMIYKQFIKDYLQTRSISSTGNISSRPLPMILRNCARNRVDTMAAISATKIK